VEELFAQFARSIALAIEGVAVLVIAFGTAEATVRLMGRLAGRGRVVGQRKDVWLRFAVWLLLGLEFELAADVVRTVIAPSWQELGQLGTIAVIRTFLNYFLEKDLEKYGEAGRPTGETKVAAAPPVAVT
jgi:uncharacterized membrane protein